MRLLKNTSTFSDDLIRRLVGEAGRELGTSHVGLLVNVRKTKHSVRGCCWDTTRIRIQGAWHDCTGYILLSLRSDAAEYEVAAIVAHEMSHHADNTERRKTGKKIPFGKEKRAYGFGASFVRSRYGEEAAERAATWHTNLIAHQRVIRDKSRVANTPRPGEPVRFLDLKAGDRFCWVYHLVRRRYQHARTAVDAAAGKPRYSNVEVVSAISAEFIEGHTTESAVPTKLGERFRYIRKAHNNVWVWRLTACDK